MDNLAQAIQFAHEAHEGQVRKFNDEPYINHPVRVMKAVACDRNWGGMKYIAMAAVLHDVVEDTDRTLDSLPLSVKRYVFELTNVYTTQAYPVLNRRARKKLEFERLTGTSMAAKTIKLYDRIDNLESWFQIPMTPGMIRLGRTYARESWDLMMALATSSLSYLTIEVGMLAAQLRDACKP